MQNLDERFVMINMRRGYRKIKIDDINYINIEQRNLCFHTVNNENIMSRCLRQSFINETKFIMKFNELYLIGNTLIVNLKNIKSIYPNYIEFINGAQIYYPNKYYKELLKFLM